MSAALPLPPDWETTARKFIEALHGIRFEGFVEVRAIRPDGPVQPYFCASIGEVLRVARRAARQGRNVYVGVATRQDRRGGGGKGNLVACRAAHVDVDFNGDLDGAELDRRLAALGVPPSVLVASGGGRHPYWILDKPLGMSTEESRQQVEAINRGLAEALGGDAAWDASRVMRLPGTINYPSRKKRERGRVPVETALLEVSERRYRLQDFEHLTRPAGRSPRKVEFTPGAVGLPDRFAADLQRDPKLEARWEGDTTGLEDTSNSGLDMGLAALLVKHGYEDDKIHAVLRERRRRAGACEKPHDYYARTIGKARDSAQSRAAQTTSATSVASVAYVAPRDASTWPHPMREAAFYGLAGEFVHLVGPHTEADPAGLLVQFLVEFGNVIGRGPHFVAEADRHYTNLFTVLVGETAKGRKGSSHGQVHTRFQALDEDWAQDRRAQGLSSGEGLIWQVRDAIEKREAIKEKGRVIDYQDVVVDPGIEDKRLLVVEPEFASTLRLLGREGNILSAVIRQAWDAGILRSLTKNSPGKATNAHISIIGHITRDELRRYLDRTEAGNGFANRFLWVCVRRSKMLPEGGRIWEVDFTPFVGALRAAVEFAREGGELRRDEQAREVWRDKYADLSQGRPGLLGAVTSRAEPQVMRLACIYALLDRTSQIRLPHLEAALEVWRYCFDSAAHIFGRSLGDPLADEILRALEASTHGMTRTAIRDRLGRHRSREMASALNLLHEHRLARFVYESTAGRSAERWFAGSEEPRQKRQMRPKVDAGSASVASVSPDGEDEAPEPSQPARARLTL